MQFNKFHIEIVDSKKILVLPTSYLRTEVYLEELEGVLNKQYKNVSCVYFDFLIRNGLSDRYYSAKYVNGRILLNSFSKVEVLPKISALSDSFFAKNLTLISNSYLTKAQKFILKRKLTAKQLD
ncbi:hypothetical protein EYV94_12920 [Puteibacter caeruleilacunae]|nr:hypothetical protein EYV94_12920 [Puteibacter caeruleilacunae]